MSINGMVTLQFGVPDTELTIRPFLSRAVLAITAVPTLWHVAAFSSWMTALIAWRRRAPGSADASFVGLCLMALGSLVVFHTFYGDFETYLYSAHAWPYVVLPGLAVAMAAARSNARGPAWLLAIALACAATQTVNGLRSLDRLPTQPGVLRPVGAPAREPRGLQLPRAQRLRTPSAGATDAQPLVDRPTVP
jgi:hypothetical protein